VFENGLLRRISGQKKKKVTEGWGELHNDQFHNIYSSYNIIMGNKPKRMRWVGHVELTGSCTGLLTRRLLESTKTKDHLKICKHSWQENVKKAASRYSTRTLMESRG
jgi:hypothetical protein